MKISRIIGFIGIASVMTNQAAAWQKDLQSEGRRLWNTSVQEQDGYFYIQKEQSVIQENNELITAIDRALGKSAESSLGEDYQILHF